VATTATIADYISERGPQTAVYQTGASPTEQQIAEAEQRAGDSDLVVVTTMRAWASAPQQQLVTRLVATGTPVIVAAVRDPYDIAYFTEAPTYVATYGFRSVSLKSLVEAMFGEIAPSGLLPVDIPRADNPSEVLYPFGHGLTY
jgi:beta-N-acetylhexosaminidase